LVHRRLVGSRAAAQRAIDAGLVLVAGVAAPKASTLVAPSDPVALAGGAEAFVGRGGLKLDAALEAFGVAVSGRRAVDVGAATGGFTDCLLQHGAHSVVAIDVGYGQLDWRLRGDRRVTVVERTNIRLADPAALGAPFDLVVADLSFISLRTVAPQLAALGGAGADWVLLVKPQFEVGRERLPRGGVVVDPEAMADAISGVVRSLSAAGIGAIGIIRSPITGASGNVEFLVHGVRGPRALTADDVAAVVGPVR
jgi:23S rRNA (cytidine1920-2'-O)/16S rRNA (cytidine1409-2'-O)-methyltransferase